MQRGTRTMILSSIFPVLVWLHFCSCLSEFHGMLTTEDVLSYTGKEEIQGFDIITPEFYDERLEKRSTALHTGPTNMHVKFRAFNDEFLLKLQRNDWLVPRNLRVEFLGENGEIRTEDIPNKHCHYHAEAISHPGSVGALSSCSGMRGLISQGDVDIHIEPLKKHHNEKLKRSIDSGQLHIIYKRNSKSEGRNICPSKEASKKWKDIRDTFRKSRKRRATKSGQEGKILKLYKYEHQLEFLLPHMIMKETESNILPEDSDVDEEFTTEQETEQPLSDEEGVVPTTSVSKTPRKTKRSYSKDSDIDRVFVDYLNTKKTKDENDLFFESMSLMCKKLPQDKQECVRYQVHKLLYEAQNNL